MSQTNQSESAPLFGGVLAAVKDVVMDSVTSVAEGIKDVVEDTTHYRITKDREPQNIVQTEQRLEEIHVKAEIAKERLAGDAELALDKIVDVTENVVDAVVGNVQNVKEGVKENAVLVKNVVAEEVTEAIEEVKDVVEDNTNYIVTKDRLPQNKAIARKHVEDIIENGEVAKGRLVGNAEHAVHSAIEGLKDITAIVEDNTKFVIPKDQVVQPVVVELKTTDLTNDVNKAIERAHAAQPKIVENVTVDLTDRLKNLVPKIEENITVDLTDRLKNLVPKDDEHIQGDLKDNANWAKEGVKDNLNYAKDTFGENASQKENTHFTQNVLADNLHGKENPSEVLAKGLPVYSADRIPEYSPNINVLLNDPLRFERAVDK